MTKKKPPKVLFVDGDMKFAEDALRQIIDEKSQHLFNAPRPKRERGITNSPRRGLGGRR